MSIWRRRAAWRMMGAGAVDGACWADRTDANMRVAAKAASRVFLRGVSSIAAAFALNPSGVKTPLLSCLDRRD